jgi:peptidoglycan/xylan/chitin deacetylase (PgdA/CDA1 family)
VGHFFVAAGHQRLETVDTGFVKCRSNLLRRSASDPVILRSAAMYARLRKAGYTLVGWSWGMWDWNWWRGPNVDPLVTRLARSTSNGSILVIHDGHHVDPRADRRHAIELVKRLIPRLRNRGFTFRTLGDAPPGSS